MTKEGVIKAMEEAKRFLKTCEPLLVKEKDSQYEGHFFGSKESGAVRRSSMDLTRALAEMRKP